MKFIKNNVENHKKIEVFEKKKNARSTYLVQDIDITIPPRI